MLELFTFGNLEKHRDGEVLQKDKSPLWEAVGALCNIKIQGKLGRALEPNSVFLWKCSWWLGCNPCAQG